MKDKRIGSIMRASVVAIIVNVALGIFKAIVGLITRSVAISMDGINNITDAASSLITILAAVLSGKAPDKKHPFGYGRIEYIGTLLIGGLILYAGITAFTESLDKIIYPEETEYTAVVIFIIIIAVAVKIALTLYIIAVGKRTMSDSLIASGKEAIGDVLISVATVLSAVLYMFTGFAADAYLGVVIALLIIKAGLETLKETVGRILGEPAQVSLVRDIKKYVSQFEGVEGAYDLVLHSYGPDSYMATIHIAVNDGANARELDDMTRLIQKGVYEEFGVHLTSVGIYAVNTTDDAVMAMREHVKSIVTEDQDVHQLHGFYLNKERKEMSFDLVVGFAPKDRRLVYEAAVERVRKEYPDYIINANMDSDFNEL